MVLKSFIEFLFKKHWESDENLQFWFYVWAKQTKDTMPCVDKYCFQYLFQWWFKLWAKGLVRHALIISGRFTNIGVVSRALTCKWHKAHFTWIFWLLSVVTCAFRSLRASTSSAHEDLNHNASCFFLRSFFWSILVEVAAGFCKTTVRSFVSCTISGTSGPPGAQGTMIRSFSSITNNLTYDQIFFVLFSYFFLFLGYLSFSRRYLSFSRIFVFYWKHKHFTCVFSTCGFGFFSGTAKLINCFFFNHFYLQYRSHLLVIDRKFLCLLSRNS